MGILAADDVAVKVLPAAAAIVGDTGLCYLRRADSGVDGPISKKSKTRPIFQLV